MYYDAAEKLRTVTGGVTVTGDITANNITLGTALEGWGANSHVIQLGDGTVDNGALAWNTISGGDTFDWIYQAYFDGTNYKHAAGSAAATRIAQYAGDMRFDRKAAGTDNATFTWDISMRIDSSGNVGIGQVPASSSDNFTVLGNYMSNFMRNVTSGNRGYDINIGAVNGSGTNIIGATIVGEVASGDANGALAFETRTSGSVTEKMRIASGGNVGIGESNPDRLLHLTASATPIVRFTGNGSNQANYAYAEIEFENADDSASSFTVDASIVVRSSESNGNGGQLCFNTGVEGNSERMRIDSNGNVGIGQSPASSNDNFTVLGNYRSNFLRNVTSGNRGYDINIGAVNGSGTNIIGAQVSGEVLSGDTNGALGLYTRTSGSVTQKLRIDENGIVMTGKSSAGLHTAGWEERATGVVGLALSSGNSYYFSDTANYKFYVNANGGISNYQSNNVNLSDEREKKNISSLSSKWDAVKKWSLKEFHFNSDADSDSKKVGVIAQDVETDHPDLVTEFDLTDTDKRKAVKEQQMTWMAIKALQEAMAKIETLEARLTALEGS